MPVDLPSGRGAARSPERALVLAKGPTEPSLEASSSISAWKGTRVGPPGGTMTLAARLGWRCEERG